MQRIWRYGLSEAHLRCIAATTRRRRCSIGRRGVGNRGIAGNDAGAFGEYQRPMGGRLRAFARVVEVVTPSGAAAARDRWKRYAQLGAELSNTGFGA